jgi:hypothetical protein
MQEMSEEGQKNNLQKEGSCEDEQAKGVYRKCQQ